MLELAINRALPGAKSARSVEEGDSQSFTSHIVSYIDTENSHLLKAWQNAINGIVRGSVLQINPIVSHNNTYKNACLYEPVDRAGLAAAVVNKDMEMNAASQPSLQSVTKNYPYRPDQYQAPVQNTLRTLSAGFVQEIISAQSDSIPAKSKEHLRSILAKLQSSFLIIVPFHWPVGLSVDSGKPGGCLFCVVGPGRNNKALNIQNLARRCALVLSQAALAQAAYQSSFANTKPMSPEQKKIVLTLRDINRALKAAKYLRGSERIDRVMPLLAPWEDQAARAAVQSELMKEPLRVEHLLEMVITKRFGISRSTAFSWKKNSVSAFVDRPR